MSISTVCTLAVCATHCNKLQHTATHCHTLQYTAADQADHLDHSQQYVKCNSMYTVCSCYTLLHTATHCNRLNQPSPISISSLWAHISIPTLRAHNVLTISTLSAHNINLSIISTLWVSASRMSGACIFDFSESKLPLEKVSSGQSLVYCSVCCSVLQCVAVCCSVCCSVL